MVAAISVATPAFLLFMAIGMLFGIGGTSLISRSLGEGKAEKAKNASAFCFWTGLGIGIIAMTVIFIFAVLYKPVEIMVVSDSDEFRTVQRFYFVVKSYVLFRFVATRFNIDCGEIAHVFIIEPSVDVFVKSTCINKELFTSLPALSFSAFI